MAGAVDPPRRDGTFTVAGEDGTRPYRRRGFGAVRDAAEKKASAG